MPSIASGATSKPTSAAEITPLLETAEQGEDAAKKAYKEALEGNDVTDPRLRQLLTTQQSHIQASHDKVKALRDTINCLTRTTPIAHVRNTGHGLFVAEKQSIGTSFTKPHNPC